MIFLRAPIFVLKAMKKAPSIPPAIPIIKAPRRMLKIFKFYSIVMFPNFILLSVQASRLPSTMASHNPAVNTAKQQQKKLELKTDRKIASVQCDSDMIYDAVLNLVLNALCAVPEASGVVRLTTESNIENQQVIVRVIDNGPGIEDTNVIFQPFHTTKPTQGSGLGLAIVDNIAAMHNGRIEVTSSPPNGSEFTLVIPVKQKKTPRSKPRGRIVSDEGS